jgi:hypothetical protein
VLADRGKVGDASGGTKVRVQAYGRGREGPGRNWHVVCKLCE